MDALGDGTELPAAGTTPPSTTVVEQQGPKAAEATVATLDDLTNLELSILSRMESMLAQFLKDKDKSHAPLAAGLPIPAEELALTNSTETVVPHPIAFVKPPAEAKKPVVEPLANGSLPTVGLGATPIGATTSSTIPITDDGGPKPQNGGEGSSKEYSAVPHQPHI